MNNWANVGNANDTWCHSVSHCKLARLHSDEDEDCDDGIHKADGSIEDTWSKSAQGLGSPEDFGYLTPPWYTVGGRSPVDLEKDPHRRAPVKVRGKSL